MSEHLGFSKGLAGVVADSTAISQVQGEVGRLIYRGIPIDELAKESNFEETAYFILFGKLPNQSDYNEFKNNLRNNRTLSQEAQEIIANAPSKAHPMSILQSVVASFAYDELDFDIKNEDENVKTAIKLVSQLSTAVANISRVRQGLSLVPPRDDLNHAQNFLYMLHGQEASSKEAHMFDTALLLHIDHDLNASTFTGRVVASTEAKLTTAISAAIGALSGPLHGGANERVLAMADSIKEPNRAQEWTLNAIETHKKVMGFGHRVYRKMDPRAKVLRTMLEELVSDKGGSKTYEILKIVHDTMIEALGQKQKDYIWPNVDFWSGALYRLMGIEHIDFTPVFAVARVVGWCAHILEMWRDNRIFRPKAEYVGQKEQAYVPMSERV